MIYPAQSDHIGSVGSGYTLIESILSTEWQCLKIKTDLYKAITLLKCVMLLTLKPLSHWTATVLRQLATNIVSGSQSSLETVASDS